MNIQTLSQNRTARNVELKWRRVLRALVDRPCLNRFQAEKDEEIHDHVLPTTVSELEKKGIRVDRRLVKLPGFRGTHAIIAEYSLDDDQRQRARILLSAE